MPVFYFLIFFFMKVLKEFRDFAMKGNVVDLAVGVIIGGAFGKIVTSLVGDIIMPLIGLITGGIDFSSLSYTVGSAKVNYGMFLQTTVDFLIVAFSIFMIIQLMNKAMKKKPAEVAPAGPTDVELLTEIRDLLKKNA